MFLLVFVLKLYVIQYTMNQGAVNQDCDAPYSSTLFDSQPPRRFFFLNNKVIFQILHKQFWSLPNEISQMKNA